MRERHIPRRLERHSGAASCAVPGLYRRITRNLALKRYDYLTAAKRSAVAVNSLEELDECVSGSFSVEDEVEPGAWSGL